MAVVDVPSGYNEGSQLNKENNQPVAGGSLNFDLSNAANRESDGIQLQGGAIKKKKKPEVIKISSPMDPRLQPNRQKQAPEGEKFRDSLTGIVEQYKI